MLQNATATATPPKNIDYSTDFENIDSMLGELATPKQEFKQQPEATAEAAQPGQPNIYDPTNQFLGAAPQQPLSEADKLRTGRQIARMVDDGAGFLGGMIAGKIADSEKYKADKQDLAELEEAWGEYMKTKNFAMPPGAYLAFKNATVYGPKLAIQAVQDRRFNKMQEEINDSTKRMSKLEKEIENLKKQEAKEA